MLASSLAAARYAAASEESINIGYGIQVGIGIGQDRAAIIEASDLWHVGVPYAVHLATPVPNVTGGKHSVFGHQVFQSETGLFNVAGAIVGILSAYL